MRRKGSWVWVGLGMLAGSAILADAPADKIKPAAKVNGEVITQADVDAVLRERLIPADLSAAERHEVQSEVLDMLIDDALLRQYLQIHGPRVSRAQVDRWLQRLEESLRSKNQTLEQFCRSQGMTEKQLRASVVRMLQWVGYVDSKLPEEELRRYYEENRDYFDQVNVRASHILIRVSATASKKQKEAIRSRLQALRADILAGKIDFAEAARKFSHCPTGERGGDLGYFPRKFAVHETIAKTAFSLQPGQISDVIETDLGFHLLMVTDQKPGVPSRFEDVRHEVREMAAAELMQKLLERERRRSLIEVYLDRPKK
ncbi:MAG: peptidylprolyl isomerase [Gemmatales bacterium]|nr:MAG: peptidylprolyl isomerase [Gemmatales bacterium]